DRMGVGHGRRASQDGDGAPVDQDSARGVAADADGVVEVVARDGQLAPLEDGADGRDDALGQRLHVRQEPAVAGLLADWPANRVDLFRQQASQPGQRRCHEMNSRKEKKETNTKNYYGGCWPGLAPGFVLFWPAIRN